jgi:phosphatidate cytidylyltransferase
MNSNAANAATAPPSKKPDQKACMSFDFANLRLRTITALVLAPIALLAVYTDGWWYIAVVTLVLALGLREWLKLARPNILLSLLAIPYFGGFGLALFYLRNIPVSGTGLVYYLLAVVWGTDIGAFAAGKLIGGPKLSPILSPGKTWAGLLGGMALAGISGYVVAHCFRAYQPAVAFGLAIIMAVFAQIGDLFESWLKRQTGVKESGECVPGHGGMLDRIDGLVFAAIFFAIFMLATAKHLHWW